MFESNKEYTITQVAAVLKMSRWVINDCVRTGKIPSRMGRGPSRPNTHLISGKDANAYAESLRAKKPDEETAKLHNQWLTTPLRATQ